MSTGESKFDAFNVGDKIFYPSIQQKEIDLPCPDCLDTKTWTVTTPAGLSREIKCPRCRGGDRNWLHPRRYERTLEIQELEVSEVTIKHRKGNDPEEAVTDIRYRTRPWVGDIRQDRAYRTREEAEAAGETLLAEAAAREQTEWEKEQERQAERSGSDIVNALERRANERFSDLDAKVDALREKMLDAVRYPTLDGPKVSARPYGAPEITSEALANWLNGLLDASGLEGWSEEELHEATCHC